MNGSGWSKPGCLTMKQTCLWTFTAAWFILYSMALMFYGNIGRYVSCILDEDICLFQRFRYQRKEKNEKEVWGPENKTPRFYQPWSTHQRRAIICILQWRLVKIQSIESRCGFLVRFFFFFKVRVAKTSWEQRPQANISQRTLKVQGTFLAYEKSYFFKRGGWNNRINWSMIN